MPQLNDVAMVEIGPRDHAPGANPRARITLRDGQGAALMVFAVLEVKGAIFTDTSTTFLVTADSGPLRGY